MMVNIDMKALQKIGIGLAIAVTSWTANWLVTADTRLALAEDRLQTVSELTTENTSAVSAISKQINEYNAELVALVSKQDLRLAKLETIIEFIVEQERVKLDDIKAKQ